MNCYFHPDAESVGTCGKCGVALCRECESNAFLRTHDGTGQALCNRCSLTEVQSSVNYEASWLKKRAIKLVICAILVFIGIISFMNSNDGVDGIPYLMLFWFVSGVIANIGLQKEPGSVKSQVKDAVDEYKYPIATFLGKILGYTIFAPVFLIVGLISYLRTKSVYAHDVSLLNRIKASMDA